MNLCACNMFYTVIVHVAVCKYCPWVTNSLVPRPPHSFVACSTKNLVPRLSPFFRGEPGNEARSLIEKKKKTHTL